MASEPNYRDLCLTCFRGPLNCYCHRIRRFQPKIRFAILIHGREARKHVATGRIAHLCLEDSMLLEGYNYTHDARVNALLADPQLHCVVLYPGKTSLNLSALPGAARDSFVPAGKELIVFVVDGTWVTARKTMSRSANLQSLPRISFDPAAPSRIRIRRQPRDYCLTTLEAVHQTIELLGPGRGFDVHSRAHDGMLLALDGMVDEHLHLRVALSHKRRRTDKNLR